MTRHIILIGAARSGTKLLRDALADATGIGVVPYDVGYVWRYRNEGVDHDALDPALARPRVQDFIRRYIDRYATSASGIVIEKTVGNTLRVPFVHRVLPNAVFVHLIRNGVDVAESTKRQWLRPPDRRYLLAKMRHFPARLGLTYGRKYLMSVAARYVSQDSRVGTWGVRYRGIDQDLCVEDLLTVCARQWRFSVDLARRDFAALGVDPIVVRYEDLVQSPTRELCTVIDRLGLSVQPERLSRAVARIEPTRQGVGLHQLSPWELEVLDRELGPTMEALAYSRPLEMESRCE